MKKTAKKKNIKKSSHHIFRYTPLIAILFYVLTWVLFYLKPEIKQNVYDCFYGWEDKLYCAIYGPYDNLEMGTPLQTDAVINRKGYALGYSEKYEQALWVSYKLTADEVRQKKTERTDNFREDPRIASGTATNEDYYASGFDRGHLAPAADMSWSKKAMSESFFFSNMIPQYAEVNRGIWQELEDTVRKIAVSEDFIYVVTGPVFYVGKKYKTIGKNKVAVPHACYKVIYSPKHHKTIGFVIQNSKKQQKLQDCVYSVSAIEKMTGLNFFSGMNRQEQQIKAKKASLKDWNL